MGQIDVIEEILKNWYAEAFENKAFTKDYSIDGEANKVFLTVSTEPITRLYKTFRAECDLDEHQVMQAIELLEEKKDELL